jgi:hypothetical protein
MGSDEMIKEWVWAIGHYYKREAVIEYSHEIKGADGLLIVVERESYSVFMRMLRALLECGALFFTKLFGEVVRR